MNRRRRRQLEAHLRSGRTAPIDRIKLAGALIAQEPWRDLTPEERERSDGQVRLAAMRHDPLIWYHGGTPDIEVGATLLPASITGADPRGLGGQVVSRNRFVFITPEYETAVFYARHVPGGGAVWRVEPEGPVIVDPLEIRTYAAAGVPWPRAQAFCCASARVLKFDGRFEQLTDEEAA